MKNNFPRYLKLSIVGIIFLVLLILSIFIIRDNYNEIIVVTDDRNYNIVDSVYGDDKISLLRDKYNNANIIGILSIPDTSINEVVVKYTDNDYYLTHSIDGSYNKNGSIYMDYRINLDDTKKILIYGHSAPNKSFDMVPFNELEEYYSKSYYDEHKNILLELDNEIREYQIFSVYVEVRDFTYMNLNFEDNQAYYNQLLKLKSKSLYDTGVSIGEDDQILILQTCSNNKNYYKYKDRYLLVIGKRIK